MQQTDDRVRFGGDRNQALVADRLEKPALLCRDSFAQIRAVSERIEVVLIGAKVQHTP
ncbi:MAG: hypothetical protein M3069_27585 [Chloroflexota bacterium]|nr:hypothetical protein [Chloroflexota bacterium]